MISIKSIKAFTYSNSLILFIGFLQYMIPNIVLLPFIILRNFLLTKTIEIFTQEKELINANYIYPPGDFQFHIIQASAIEFITVQCVRFNSNESLITIITFIPVSFLFEIIFDFFHYCLHRGMHLVPNSYHKTHHTYIHLKPHIAFYQDPLDLLLTNSLPFLLTSNIVSVFYPLSRLEINLIIVYKVFTEIAGHSGHKSFPTSSFPQCIWIPRMLGIEMYSENHNLHHLNAHYNFSKRFTLWDKVFGTYCAVTAPCAPELPAPSSAVLR